MSGLAQTFRASWEVHGFHTIFDYIVGSTVMQHQAGKAISGWTARIGDVTVGGQPPVLEDIHSSVDLLPEFVLHLFINDINQEWEPVVHNLLVASLLQHYNDFCALLQMEPNGQFVDPDNHLFISTIKEKLSLAGVSDAVFASWKEEVRVGFFNRNLPALAIVNYPHHLGDVSNSFHKVMLDPRCFVDHMNSLSAHYQSLHAQACQQQTAIGNLTLMVHQMQHQLEVQSDLLHRFLPPVPGAGPTPEDSSLHTVPVTPSPSKTANSTSENIVTFNFVKRFSIGVSSLPKACTIANHFHFYFAEGAKDGYEKDKATKMEKKE